MAIKAFYSDIYLKKAVEIFSNEYSLKIKNEKKFCAVGSIFKTDNYEKDGKLLVGEAVGLQDFLFGFGIKYAITSGYLAAKSIYDNLSYNKLIKNDLQKRQFRSLMARMFYHKLSNRGYERVIRGLSGKKLIQKIMEKMNEY